MTMPHEISETGHIVGMRTSSAFYMLWPFTWVRGEYRALWPESPDSTRWPPEAPTFLAGDINERGQILGLEHDGELPGSREYEARAAVWSEDGEVLARNDVVGSPVDLDNRGRALLNVTTDPATYTVRAAVWDFAGTGEVTDLGTLGGANSRGAGMNVQGHVAGTSQTTSGDEHAFLWDDGEMTDLGTLGGSTSRMGENSETLPLLRRSESALNAWGHVVGWSKTADGADHAVLWRDGQAIDLGTLGGANSRAAAINELGQVVGWSETADGTRHAFLWQAGRMTDLGALDDTAPAGSSSSAIDVNNRGQVLGTSGPGAVIWQIPLWEGTP